MGGGSGEEDPARLLDKGLIDVLTRLLHVGLSNVTPLPGQGGRAAAAGSPSGMDRAR